MSKKFVLNVEETASLRSAPRICRHYCDVDVRWYTASGATKYFMKLKLAVTLVDDDDDSVSSGSSMEVDEPPKSSKAKNSKVDVKPKKTERIVKPLKTERM